MTHYQDFLDRVASQPGFLEYMTVCAVVIGLSILAAVALYRAVQS